MLYISLSVIVILSFAIAPRAFTVESFFRGVSKNGTTPQLITLILSQVTTWIFARSLLNAAILGFYYGIAGSLAYAAYYLSFFTGGLIVDRLRFKIKTNSIQEYLSSEYGSLGVWSYNFVIGIRLMSEVFANLLVVGLVFGVAGSSLYNWSIILLALVTLGYSMLGGLSASLRTDVFQTIVLYCLLGFLLLYSINMPQFDMSGIVHSSPDPTSPGWILMAVALLQIWSYPLHDPVMMDRGFLSDQKTTQRSFWHAGWISIVGIMIFGIMGTFAGLNRTGSDSMMDVLQQLYGTIPMTIFNLALIISAVSTLDSTFSSASKLVVFDMKLMSPTLRSGRIAMAVFLVGGLIFLFIGSNDLFDAVAISGTASMFLAPVVFFGIFGNKKPRNRRMGIGAYFVTFLFAIGGSVLYFLEVNGSINIIEPMTGLAHKYEKLLVIATAIILFGCLAFALTFTSKPKEILETNALHA